MIGFRGALPPWLASPASAARRCRRRRLGLASWLLFAVVVLIPDLAAAGEAPSRLSADATWTAADSPHRVVADLLVAETSTLTIEAGATVQLGAGVGIEVRGALVARGTKERPIRFTLLDGAAGSGDGQPGEPVTWGSLTFADSARDAVLDDEGGYLSGSILEHCLFEQGSRAVWLLGASPAIIDSSFLANRIGVTPELKCGAALFVGPGSAPLIRGNKFADNEAGGFCQGGAVFVDLGQPILQDNRFLRNASAYGGALATNGLYSPIVGNLFESNRVLTKGGALSLISSSPAFLDNTVRANESAADGGGVHVCVDCDPHAAPFVLDNTITGNTNPGFGAAGLGAAYLRACADNDLHGNTGRGGPVDFAWHHEANEEDPSWAHDVSIPGNWWGTNDEAAIAATIQDGHDESTIGLVDFRPFRTGPVAEPRTRATLTTPRLRYAVEGESMPLYLTLYNPGSARKVELLILLQYGDEPPLPYRGPLDLPAAAHRDDGHLLDLPAHSVRFTSLPAGSYQPASGLTMGRWHVLLLEPDSGEPISEVMTIRFDLGNGGGT